MRFQTLFAIPVLMVVLSSCSSELPPGDTPAQQTPEASAPKVQPRLGTFALKASNGSYVSCTQAPDSAGHVLLVANRTAVGPQEVFMAWYGDDGRMGLKAANGKYVSADRNNGGVLSAVGDYVGDWETFELVDMGDGLFALKNSNGLFMGAHYELHGDMAAALVADKPEAFDWERFAVEQDPPVVNP